MLNLAFIFASSFLIAMSSALMRVNVSSYNKGKPRARVAGWNVYRCRHGLAGIILLCLFATGLSSVLQAR